jgi:indolepyruvate ferredoxin oxidoreductase
VELNGAAVERNKQAFEMGRWAIVNPEAAERLIAAEVVQKPKTLEEKIAFRAGASDRLPGQAAGEALPQAGRRVCRPRLKEAVAKGYHKLLAYKDEYEVARLHLETEAKAREAFDGDFKLKYHLAPPILPGKDAAGRPKKREFGPWIGRLYPVLARLKACAARRFDLFGYSRRAPDGARPDPAIPGRHGRVPAQGGARDHGRARGAGRACRSPSAASARSRSSTQNALRNSART